MVVPFLDYVESLITRALKRRQQFSTYAEARQEISITVPLPLANDHQQDTQICTGSKAP